MLHGPRAYRLEIEDLSFFGSRSAYETGCEYGFANVGVGTENLMDAEILE